MGVSPSDGVEIRLVDTSEKLELVLPQLTEGQLASFNAIVATGESSTVRLDAKTFKKLDLAQQTADWSSHSGTAFIDSEDNPQSIVIVADSVTDLRNEGLVSPFGLVDEIEGDPNESLVDQITGISIGGFSSYDLDLIEEIGSDGINVQASFIGGEVTADDFRRLVKLGVDLSEKVYLVDTPAEIKSILLSSEANISANLSNILGISSTSPAAIELTLEQYNDLHTNGSYIFGTANVEFIVSGTAKELENLFKEFGTNFEQLSVGISFRVTDGNEIKLNAALIDALDGRLTGAIVKDTSANITEMLDEATLRL